MWLAWKQLANSARRNTLLCVCVLVMVGDKQGFCSRTIPRGWQKDPLGLQQRTLAAAHLPSYANKTFLKGLKVTFS